MMIDGGVILSVLTFNIWGLPEWIARNKDDRIKAIASALKSMSDIDVICLQEVWIEVDYLHIKNAVKETLPYSHYFYSGVTGSGVCIFTKWPITEILFHQWPLNGYIHMVHHGDWFAGKGVGLVVLDVNGYQVNVYNTHLHAQYHEDDSYLVHRVEQAFDTAMFIRLTSAHSDFSVLAGDLNTPPGSLCEQLILHVAELSDSYTYHDDDSSGGTNDCCRNSYSSPDSISSKSAGLRIDYILSRGSHKTHYEVLAYKFPLEKTIPGKGFSYSDHEAVLTKFNLSRAQSVINTQESNKEALQKALLESIKVCTSALEDTNKKSMFYWAVSITIFSLLLITPMAFDRNVIHSSLFVVSLVFAVILLTFFILMATLWCKLEFHGILGVRERMVVLLDSIKIKT